MSDTVSLLVFGNGKRHNSAYKIVIPGNSCLILDILFCIYLHYSLLKSNVVF